MTYYNYIATNSLQCDWLKLYGDLLQLFRDIFQLDRDIFQSDRSRWLEFWHKRPTICMDHQFKSSMRCWSQLPEHRPWGSCRYAKLWVAHAPGMPGTFSQPPQVSDPDMQHGTCVTHVPWSMPGSLTSGFLWRRWRGKRSRHSQRMRDPQGCVFGKRPIGSIQLWRLRDVSSLPRIGVSLQSPSKNILSGEWSLCWLFGGNIEVYVYAYPANTWRNNNVFIMSKRRFDDMMTFSWLSGVAVACQRCRASDPGSLPGLASGR